MFWDNFVTLCAQRGTSPNAVAAELKKSSGSVTAWKNGSVPRETTLKKIADYFEISIDQLLYDQKEKSPAPEGAELDAETIQLREIWDSADKEEREALLAMAKMLKARRSK